MLSCFWFMSSSVILSSVPERKEALTALVLCENTMSYSGTWNKQSPVFCFFAWAQKKYWRWHSTHTMSCSVTWNKQSPVFCFSFPERKTALTVAIDLHGVILSYLIHAQPCMLGFLPVPVCQHTSCACVPTHILCLCANTHPMPVCQHTSCACVLTHILCLCAYTHYDGAADIHDSPQIANLECINCMSTK